MYIPLVAPSISIPVMDVVHLPGRCVRCETNRKSTMRPSEKATVMVVQLRGHFDNEGSLSSLAPDDGFEYMSGTESQPSA